MNRRQFLSSVGLAAGATLLPRLAWGQAPSPSPAPSAAALPTPPPWTPEFKALRRNVGLYMGRGGTIGWLSSKDALVAVDSQFPDSAKAFLEGLPGRSGRKFDLLFNTHHHADHTSGNKLFEPEVKTIVAHENVPKNQKAAAEAQKSVENQVYATTLFAQEWKLAVGDETLRAKHYGPAHTNGDAVLHFEKANVVHVGDLVFNRLYAVIDKRAGASLKNWIVVLEAIAKDFGKDAIYILGHGKKDFGVKGTQADLFAMRDYISGLLEFVQAHIKAGKTKADLAAIEELPRFPDHKAPKPNRLQNNLEIAFDELSAG
ncbi:MAG: MBL fold metallo-hydrolase [Verrucomicrobia bacterium]|nr:MBL fold metallo-hydrolase [Verrucomicrobiota bacterium]